MKILKNQKIKLKYNLKMNKKILKIILIPIFKGFYIKIKN